MEMISEGTIRGFPYGFFLVSGKSHTINPLIKTINTQSPAMGI